MAKKRKYSPSAGSDVENEMRRYKRGTAKSGKGGKGGKGGKVKSRKQAIAIGLSKARKKRNSVSETPNARQARAVGRRELGGARFTGARPHDDISGIGG